MTETLELYKQTLAHLLAPIQPFLEDDSISEVMINGYKEIYIERRGKLEKTSVCFPDQHALNAAMRNIAQYAGKRFVPENLSIEARLPDGSRVHIVQAPAARNGLCASIRKFSEEKLDMHALVRFGSITEQASEYLKTAVIGAQNIVISGGTGSGKTTLLNCLSAMIPEHERILVLEDAAELQLQQEHVVSFEAQAADRNGKGGIGIRELFVASLRMRPDRIVVGECRGGEAIDMIQAMTSGHGGSLTTCHASTPQDAMSRLETMALMGSVNIPLAALRSQLASAVDLVVQINRQQNGQRKLTHISRNLPLSQTGEYVLEELFALDYPDLSREKASLEWKGQKESAV